VKEFSPDLVFLDVQMPGLDGFGVIKKLLDRKCRCANCVCHCVRSICGEGLRGQRHRLPAEAFDRKRVSQAVEKARQKLESAGSPNDQIGTIVKCWSSNSGPRPLVLLKSAAALPGGSEGYLLRLHRRRHHYRRCHGNGRQSNCRTLEELLDSLDPNTFWRAHAPIW